MKCAQTPMRVLSVLVIIILNGCSYASLLPAPSNEQVQAFIDREQLAPLAQHKVDDFYVIVAKQNKDVGCYAVDLDPRGEVSGGPLASTRVFRNEEPQIQPLSVLYTVYSGNEIFCITINDARLFDTASSIDAVFYDGATISMPVAKQTGILIWRNTPTLHSAYKQVRLYDAQHNEILTRTP